MVKIREGLPLVDGQTTQADSAALAAQLVASQRSHQSANSYAQIPLDIKYQLSTNKLHTTFDRSALHSFHSDDLKIENDYADNSFISKKLTFSEKDLETIDLDQVNIDVPTWLDNVAKRIGQESVPNLSAACEFIRNHMNTSESERSGAYVTGIGMTDILTYLYQDEDALVAAMLYRSARKSVISLDDIEKKFGTDVSTLVKDTLAMGKLSEIIESNKRLEDHFVNNQRDQLSNIYSMLISVTNDVRVVLIKLAERTFAMRELTFSKEERQNRVAREVMTIYAPLAHRLGIAQLKWELEDLAFRYLAPDRYKEIAKLLSEKRSERESYIQRVQKN
ncbi:hypothetical protein Psyaliredsea_05550 [Psychrobacter alimentarius]